MHTDRNTFRIQLTGLALLSVAWVLVPVTISFAAEAGSQVNIASNGQVIVRDAVVKKVQANVITAEAVWGASSISWTVVTTGATRVTPSPEAGLSAVVKPGDRISFTGTLDFASGHPSVLASAVKNVDMVRSSVVIVGVAEAIDRSASTVSVQTESGPVSIYANVGTIITFEGNGSSMRDIEIGDTVRAEGTFHAGDGTLRASRIVYTHQEATDAAAPTTVEEDGPGILGSIVSWIRDTRGVFSIR